MMVSLDGYFEGVNHDLSWHHVDAEFEQFANAQLDETDTLIFGHKTYDLMADYWPAQLVEEPEDGTAVRMNKLPKIVFSHSPLTPEWKDTKASSDLVAKVTELKQQAGKDIAVLGSSHLGKEMLEAGFLDEVRIMVNPVFIGEGSPLFAGLRKELTLTNTRTFKNGNVLLTYSAA